MSAGLENSVLAVGSAYRTPGHRPAQPQRPLARAAWGARQPAVPLVLSSEPPKISTRDRPRRASSAAGQLCSLEKQRQADGQSFPSAAAPAPAKQTGRLPAEPGTPSPTPRGCAPAGSRTRSGAGTRTQALQRETQASQAATRPTAAQTLARPKTGSEGSSKGPRESLRAPVTFPTGRGAAARRLHLPRVPPLTELACAFPPSQGNARSQASS